MIRKGKIVILLLIISALCAGCWDRREINDIALLMASSLDVEKDGRFRGAVQIVIPARQIGNTAQEARPYFVESGTGLNVQQMVQEEQSKLSRRLFISHRRVLFIGEKLARRGLKDILDHWGRNPATRLRTFVVVVKGAEGEDAINTDYPLEFVPSEAVREMQILVGGTAVTMRDLLNDASAEGVEPVMGAIELVSYSGAKGKGRIERTFKLSGTAIFKDLKLRGYLNNRDSQYMLWVKGKLEQGTITAVLPEQKSRVSVDIDKAQRMIEPSVERGRVKIAIHLRGEGTVEENNSRLDFSIPENLRLAENALERTIREQTRKMIEDVQKKYEADIFGFGEELHKKDNKAWRRLKKDWDKKFAEARISVDADFALKRAGMSGPPLQLKEREVMK
ncbi:Ger(x)C family spore germination protein [Paenibacillus alkalitolerans]|uniref:Ger(x)C family spore germination protein n=1 Tax=Paenibacillus alkalitolerans TaxID=2799335 RepID=UPI0018F736AE|nr:Ger(x)C family spore germination protein [Paenibacillus alkalitolerans]